MGSSSYILSVLGCGTMATAVLIPVLESLSTAQIPISRVIATTRTSKSADRLKTKLSNHSSIVEISQGLEANVKAANEADIIILGFKPYMVTGVLSSKEISEALQGKLVISLLAGISSTQLYEVLSQPDGPPHNAHILRVIPNVAAAVKESMTAIEEPSPSARMPQEWLDLTTKIFEQVGKVIFLPPVQFGIATVMLGACIALTTIAVDGILDGAVAQGMTRAQALQITSQCLQGTAKLLSEEGGQHPATLRESISSPRGCTIQAIMGLEKANARSAFAEAIVRGVDHLGKMAQMQDK